ncbi:TetR/AcrR family transcriptional regulator [Desulfosarcina sp.]|uniref:TetR/AcrR family transcriptional regulator n=1 Tax=Desulfosarcina sp. TaxID=2027861 RepID=UPI003970C147
MPPKQRFSPQDVIEAAFQVVRKQGWEGFSARTIANELNSSTRPIYDYFNSMENIEAEVVKKILSYYVHFLSQERTGDKWLDQALGYVLFASTEKHLFRCINDEKHTPSQRQFAQHHWVELGEALSEDERFKNISAESKHKVRAARWIMIHGLSHLISNGWFKTPITEDSILSEELGITLVEFLKKVNHGLYLEFNG